MFAFPGVAIEILLTLWRTVTTRTSLCLCFAEKMSQHVLNLRFCHFFRTYFFPVIAHRTFYA